MRMWTKVLVEDDSENVGGFFDAYYFIGPDDARRFFAAGGATNATAGIEEYFARKYATDLRFRDRYSKEGDQWEQRRDDFYRFYALRGSAAFSKGCHDEWNILCKLNDARLAVDRPDVGSQIAIFFDSKQVDPGAASRQIVKGYAI